MGFDSPIQSCPWVHFIDPKLTQPNEAQPPYNDNHHNHHQNALVSCINANNNSYSTNSSIVIRLALQSPCMQPPMNEFS